MAPGARREVTSRIRAPGSARVGLGAWRPPRWCLGVASLTPADADMDTYGLFLGALILLLPLVLAGGFPWDDVERAAAAGRVVGGAARLPRAGDLPLAVVGRATSVTGTPCCLALLAVSAAAATQLVGQQRRAARVAWRARANDVGGDTGRRSGASRSASTSATARGCMQLWDEVITSQRWSEGPLTDALRSRRGATWNGLERRRVLGVDRRGVGGAGVRRRSRETVLCPSNTFMATPLAAVHAGAERAVRRLQPLGPLHVVRRLRGQGGTAPTARGDCRAHRRSHRVRDRADRGAVPRGGHLSDRGLRARARRRVERTPAGVVGRRWAVVVLRDQDGLDGRGRDARLAPSGAARLRARAFATTASPTTPIHGLNFRLSEFTAALGLVQTERMEEIVAFKNAAARRWLDPAHPGRLELPDGMTSGLYKYIVFEEIERSTGKVYDTPCHRIMGHADASRTPTGCAETTGACRSTTGPKAERARRDRARPPRRRRVPAAGRPRSGQVASGSAVVVGVVQQQNVAARYIAATPSPRCRAGVACRVQSRPQRDHSIGVQPRARTAPSAGQE